MAEEAVAIARAEGDADALVRGLQALWMSRFFRGQRDGLEAICQEQLQIATAQGDLWSLALSEASIASLRFDSDPPAADAQLRSAVEHARQTENPFAIAFVALNVARVQSVRGNVPEMRAAFAEAIEVDGRLGDSRFVLVGASDLAHGLRRAGELDEAETLLRETIEHDRRVAEPVDDGADLEHLRAEPVGRSRGKLNSARKNR